jgi:hypothetical protein
MTETPAAAPPPEESAKIVSPVTISIVSLAAIALSFLAMTIVGVDGDAEENEPFAGGVAELLPQGTVLRYFRDGAQCSEHERSGEDQERDGGMADMAGGSRGGSRAAATDDAAQARFDASGGCPCSRCDDARIARAVITRA